MGKKAKAPKTGSEKAGAPEPTKEKAAAPKGTPEQASTATATYLKIKIIETVKDFNSDNDLGRSVTMKEFNAAVKEARAYLKDEKTFHKNGREPNVYTAPTVKVGDSLTVTPVAGEDKGKPITGIYLEWNQKNGLAKIYVLARGKNISGRPITTS